LTHARINALLAAAALVACEARVTHLRLVVSWPAQVAGVDQLSFDVTDEKTGAALALDWRAPAAPQPALPSGEDAVVLLADGEAQSTLHVRVNGIADGTVVAWGEKTMVQPVVGQATEVPITLDQGEAFATLQQVTVAPTTLSLAPGASQMLSAYGLYSDSTLRLLDGATWSTSDSTVAQVGAGDGTVVARSKGSATVTPTIKGLHRDCVVSVKAARK
jgi:hypothetical protein